MIQRAPGELLLPEATEAPFDERLYKELKMSFLGAPEIYKDLDLTPEAKAAAIEAWRNGDEADLRPVHLDEAVLVERAEELRAFKLEIIADETIDSMLRQAYRWRVNEAIANVYMQISALHGDEQGYRRWGEFIYGKPKADIYKAALDFIAHDAETIIEAHTDNAVAVAAAHRVLGNIGDLRGDRTILYPDSETFQAVREDHFRRDTGFYALLFAGVDMPTDGKVDNAVGDPIIDRMVHDNLQSDYERVDAAGSTWGVSHTKKQVERPKIFSMVWQRFIGLSGHEIGSHLLEYVNGLRGRFRILSDIGLDRTELGNEGRALIREQAPYETFEEFTKTVRWRDVLRRDIAIGYAHGTDETELHKQGEMYDFMLAIDTMYQARLKSNNSAAEIEEKSRDKTESLLTRILRGGVYLKDKVYLEGNVGCWRAAKERGPQAISDGDLGKHDIANARHITVLQAVGVLPEAS